MLIRFCPFCTSSEIIMTEHVVTEEECRDTETYTCLECKETFFRERMYSLEEHYRKLYGNQSKDKIKSVVVEGII